MLSDPSFGLLQSATAQEEHAGADDDVRGTEGWDGSVDADVAHGDSEDAGRGGDDGSRKVFILLYTLFLIETPANITVYWRSKPTFQRYKSTFSLFKLPFP